MNHRGSAHPSRSWRSGSRGENTHGADLRALTNSAEHGVVDQRQYFGRDIATNTDNYYIVETGDYVYNPRTSSTAPVGPISKNQIGTGVMSPLYTVFRFRSDANDFFAHYFKSSRWHGYLRRVSNSGARHDRMAITIDDLMQMPIPTPSPREQQKIADCLGSLDDLIAAEGRKLEALRRHKQGLVQQLLPQPGETVPRLRFPEFRGAGKWEERLVGNVFKVTRGAVLAMPLVQDSRSNETPFPSLFFPNEKPWTRGVLLPVPLRRRDHLDNGRRKRGRRQLSNREILLHERLRCTN